MDTGVWRPILNLKNWRRVESSAKIKPTTLKFRQYCTQQLQLILGRAKLKLQAVARATIDTKVYVNDSKTKESLLGKTEAE